MHCGRERSEPTCLQVAVDIYLNVICELVSVRKIKPLVHPVAPVLDITRENVIKFNRILKNQTKKKKLKWIDIDFDILIEDKSGIVEEYKLDGTHLNPVYFNLFKDFVCKEFEEDKAATS